MGVVGAWLVAGAEKVRREGPLFDGNIYRLVSVKELENPPIINKPSDRSERHVRLALAYRKVQHVAKISLFFPPAGFDVISLVKSHRLGTARHAMLVSFYDAHATQTVL